MKRVVVTYELPIAFSMCSDMCSGRFCGSRAVSTMLGHPADDFTSRIEHVLRDARWKEGPRVDCSLVSHLLRLRDVSNSVYVSTVPPSLFSDSGAVSSIREALSAKMNRLVIVDPALLSGCERSHEFYETKIRSACFSTKWDDVVSFDGDDGSLDEYRRLSEVFCDVLKGVCEAGDVVFVASPLLLYLPGLVHRSIPGVRVVTMFTLPFPRSDMFESIPGHARLFSSVLASDCLCFQSSACLANFIRLCRAKFGDVCYDESTKVLSCDGRPRTACTTFGYSVDASDVLAAFGRPDVAAARAALSSRYAGRKVVLSVSNVADKRPLLSFCLAAIEFLSSHGAEEPPFFIGLETSADSFDTRTDSEVSRLISYASLRFGDDAIARKLCVSDAEYFALLSIADCFVLLTGDNGPPFPVVDLSIACPERRSESLIVSDSPWLSDALGLNPVNPHDVSKIARRIEAAVKPGAGEHGKGIGGAAELIASRTLQGVVGLACQEHPRVLANSRPQSDLSAIKERFSRAKRKLILLDYDGTIVDVVAMPDEAAPSKEVAKFMSDVNRRTKLIVLTGRGKRDVDEWFTDALIEVYAEFGALHRKGGKWTGIENARWMEDVRNTMKFFEKRTPGSLIREKTVCIGLHTGKCSEYIRDAQMNACQSTLAMLADWYDDMSIVIGKWAVEVRMSYARKGDVVRKILSQYDAVVCAGDDTADESMFEAVKDHENGFSIFVGEPKTATSAKYVVKDPKTLREVIMSIVS